MIDNNRVYFHADDFGVTPRQSAVILSCHSEGVLNSISVIPNVPELEVCLQLLNEEDRDGKIRRVLHLNFVEGRPVAPIEWLDMLVDETGYFACSFMQLLKWNYILKGKSRKKLKEQLKIEIAAQLDKVMQEYDFHITAIDSHQHYHMIPIVMETLLEVITEKSLKVEEIRVPVDPLMPLVNSPSVWRKVPVINWIKWGILWMHAGRNKRRLSQKEIQTPIFCGMFFTCEMKKEVVEVLLPKYKAYAQKKGKSLELMFHPGNLLERSELLDVRSNELEKFYMSDNRLKEAECLRQMERVC